MLFAELQLPVADQFVDALRALTALAAQNLVMTAAVGVGFLAAFIVLARGVAFIQADEQKILANKAAEQLKRRRGAVRRQTPDGDIEFAAWAEREAEKIAVAYDEGRLRRGRKGRVRYD